MSGRRGLAPFSLIDISCKVASVPTGGHPFWFHKAIATAASENGANIVTVGPQQENSEWVKGLLRFGWNQRAHSSVFSLRHRANESLRISNLMMSSDIGTDAILHFYEGGFREFLLLQALLRHNSGARFYFNFNLTDPWHKVLQGKNSIVPRAIVLGLLRRMIEATENRGIYSVETQHLGRLFLNNLGKNMPVYPLFSATVPSARIKKDFNTKVDLTFFPEGSSEADLCLSALEKLVPVFNVKSRFAPRWGYKLSEGLLAKATSLGVEVIDSVLGNDEYFDLYQETRVAIFPYTSEYYTVSSSGRYLDAKLAGAIPIAPKQSSLADDIAESGFGEIFEGDTSSLSNAIQVALKKNYRATPTVLTASDAIAIIQTSVPREAPLDDIDSRLIFSELAFSALVNACLGPRLSIGRHLDAFGFSRASMGAKALLNVLRKK